MVPSFIALICIRKNINGDEMKGQDKNKIKIISDNNRTMKADNHEIPTEKEKIIEMQKRLSELKIQNQRLQDKLKNLEEIYIELKKSEEKFRDLTEMLPEMVFEIDKDCKFTFINKKGIEMLGYSREELINKKKICQSISHSKQKKDNISIKELFQEEKNYPQEYYLMGKDQAVIPVEIHGSAIKNHTGKVIGFRGIVLNTTERKEYEGKIKYLSFHDKLTDLYNRAYFEEELKRLNHKRNLPISIIIGDVNNLKMINDSFGHLYGDNLLRKIAGVLKSCFRKSDVISRPINWLRRCTVIFGNVLPIIRIARACPASQPDIIG